MFLFLFFFFTKFHDKIQKYHEMQISRLLVHLFDSSSHTFLYPQFLETFYTRSTFRAETIARSIRKSFTVKRKTET